MTQPMQHENLSRAQFDPMRVEHYGLKYVPVEEAPAEVKDAHQYAGVEGIYWKSDRDHSEEYGPTGPWGMMASRHVIKPEDPVYTTQSRLREQPKGFKATHINDPYRAPKVFQDDEGKHWMVDGHHRLAERRAAGKPITVLRMHASSGAHEMRQWEEEAQADDEWHNDPEGEAAWIDRWTGGKG